MRILAAVGTLILLMPSSSTAQTPAGHRRIDMPILFEPNQGQTRADTRFLVRRRNHAIAFAASQFRLRADSVAVGISFLGANQVEPRGESRTPTMIRVANARVRSGSIRVSSYGRIRYRNVYPGIDAVFYNSDGGLRYDWVLAPGADPRVIRMRINGGRSTRVDRGGNLIVETRKGRLVHTAPRVYQRSGNQNVNVGGRFVVKGNDVGFEVGRYDRTRALIIDPEVVFASLVGGSRSEGGYARYYFERPAGLTADDAGHVWIAGTTNSPEWPEASNPALSGETDAFVARFNMNATGGPVLEAITYLGGTSWDFASGVSANNNGGAYVTGGTHSPDLPGCSTPANMSGDLSSPTRGFIAKFNAALDVETVRCLGTRAGHVVLTGVDVQSDPNAAAVYVSGFATEPGLATPGAFQETNGGRRDALVARFDMSLSNLGFLTYFGGSAHDEALAIAVRGDAVHIAGITASPNLPFAPGAATDPGNRGEHGSSPCDPDFAYVSRCQDGFVAIISSDGSTRRYAKYIVAGGTDRIEGMAVANDGAMYLIGSSWPPSDQPTRVLLHAIDAGGQFTGQWLTGGTSFDLGYGIWLESSNRLHIVGETNSRGMATADAVQPNWQTWDGFYKIETPGAAPTYYTYLGGQDQDEALRVVGGDGRIYILGITQPDYIFPQPVNATQPSPRGITDYFLIAFEPSRVMELTKLPVTQPPYVVSQPFVHQITARNRSGETIGNITVVDSLPANVVVENFEPAAPDCRELQNPHRIECAGLTIPRALSFTLTTTLRADQEGVYCDVGKILDPQRPERRKELCATVLPNSPRLIATKAGPSKASQHSSVRYAVRLTNEGGVAATGVVIRDRVGSVAYLRMRAGEWRNASNSGSCTILADRSGADCPVGDIAAGGAAEVLLTADAVVPGQTVNTAFADHAGASVVAPAAVQTQIVHGIGDLAINVTPITGGNAGYTIQVVDNGPAYVGIPETNVELIFRTTTMDVPLTTYEMPANSTCSAPTPIAGAPAFVITCQLRRPPLTVHNSSSFVIRMTAANPPANAPTGGNIPTPGVPSTPTLPPSGGGIVSVIARVHASLIDTQPANDCRRVTATSNQACN